MQLRFILAAVGLTLPLCQAAAATDTSGAVGVWSVHGQMTHVWQYHPAFRSPYRGPNSLDPGSRADETADATLFVGVRLWRGGELYADPEIDQGFGLSNTSGLAGFSSGEAYKVGAANPYFRLQRLFFRQTIDLGSDFQQVPDDANQLEGMRSADNLIISIGKISVVDIFDTNAFAHDPRRDFFNWAVIDGGAFDYAADAWGYTYGAAVEWTQSWWTLRTGLFDLSRVPNATALETRFGQYELVAEAEGHYTLGAGPGALRVLGFVNRGRMGSYADAVRLGTLTGTLPSTAAVRRYGSNPGAEINLEQQLGSGLGLFLRASINGGKQEAYEFTEINKSLSIGISLKGDCWARHGDVIGIAAVKNALSKPAQAYFAAGGQGILIGDGRLSRYGDESIMEAYYTVGITNWLSGTVDYQFISKPAYNRDRGPVSILGARFHLEM